MQPGLEQLNSQPSDEAEKEFLKCCGSSRWAQLMASERPFKGLDQISERAEGIWWSLDPKDWLEAFHSHPKIGERKAAAATSAVAQKWSESEQSGISNSAQETMDALAKLNQDYEQKFGYIFIVCAAGKTSDEMLAILRARLENSADEELPIAAGEQAKITRLRLNKLFDGAQRLSTRTLL